MSIAELSGFKRDVLKDNSSRQVAVQLQANLTNLIDLALVLKQAHWNVVGRNFRSVHLQLDEIIESVREASDEIAERVSTLGASPDGRASTVAEQSGLEEYPEGFVQVEDTIRRVADALEVVILQLRNSIGELGDVDPVSEDLCIGICGSLEKHLWMVQAQERTD